MPGLRVHLQLESIAPVVEEIILRFVLNARIVNVTKVDNDIRIMRSQALEDRKGTALARSPVANHAYCGGIVGKHGMVFDDEIADVLVVDIWNFPFLKAKV